MEKLILAYIAKLAHEKDPSKREAAEKAISAMRGMMARTAYAVTDREKKVVSRENETLRRESLARCCSPVSMMLLVIFALRKVRKVKMQIGMADYSMTGREFRTGLIYYFNHILAEQGEVAPFNPREPEKPLPFKDEAPKRSAAWKYCNEKGLIGRRQKENPLPPVVWEKKEKPTFSTAHIAVERSEVLIPKVTVRKTIAQKAREFNAGIIIPGQAVKVVKPVVVRERNVSNPREFNSPFKVLAALVKKGQ